MPSLDLLAFAAHPDDVELCAGGTMCLLARKGYRTGVVDLTRGELSTRGTPETRAEEAAEAGRIMGLAVRENLGIPDGGIDNTPAHRESVIRSLRRHRPSIVLLNAPEDRHPDHPAASRLVADACFYAGLARIETRDDDGTPQEPWRPQHALYYIQTLDLEPTFVVDVTAAWDDRMAAIQAYRSQVHSPNYSPADGEAQTFISNPEFLLWMEARARAWGYRVGAAFGEPFVYRHGPIGITDLVATLSLERAFR
jgi:bacillithiol biosynthesis deacetylase BshB1